MSQIDEGNAHLDSEQSSALAEIEGKTAADYVKALQAIEGKITEKQRAMLIAHAKSADRTLSMLALAQIAGYTNQRPANTQYGALGKLFASFFRVSKLPNKTQAMAWSLGNRDSKGHFLWNLRAPLAEALYEVGWVTRTEIADLPREAAAHEVDEDPQCTSIPETVRQALIEARIGQGAFRTRVLAIWGSACALTGCALTEVLIASHAKPWSLSSNEERLDEYNGFLLAAHVDKLFDRGLISFRDDGTMLRKFEIDEGTLGTLGLTSQLKLRFVNPRHIPFLTAHRTQFGFPL